MKGFGGILIKEFMHLRRDRTSLVIALLLPLVQMIIFGYAINFDVRHIETVVFDQDNSRESRAYLQRLQAGQYLDVIGHVSGPQEAASLLKTGAARVAVLIPAGFARDTLSGKNPQVGVMIDGSDAQVSLRARFAFISPPDRKKPGVPDARINVLFNPDSKTPDFMIPGLIAVILQIVTVALTSFSIVREKEQGTLEQLMVTPVGRLALMLGKLLPYAVLAFAELVVILYVSNVVFGISSHGSLIALAVLSIPFILASLGLGLLISTLAQTQGQALQFAILTMLPSILLSGYVSPRETMPGPLYLISNALPATHFIQITRGIVVRGAQITELLPQLGALILIATLLILASTARFRKSIA